MPIMRMKFMGLVDQQIIWATGINPAPVRTNEQNPYICDFEYPDPADTIEFMHGMTLQNNWVWLGEVVDGVLVPPPPPEE